MSAPADPVVIIEVDVPQLTIEVASGDVQITLAGPNAASVLIDVD